MVALTLGTVNRDNVWEIKPILNGWCPNIGGIGAHVLNLLLLNLLNAFAAKVLKISKTSIVLDIVDDRGKVLLLLLMLRWSYRLIHHVNIIMWLCTCRNVLKVIKLKQSSIWSTASRFSNHQGLIITVGDLRTAHHQMWWLLRESASKVLCTIFMCALSIRFVDITTISSR
jgi:hypothetical protein